MPVLPDADLALQTLSLPLIHGDVALPADGRVLFLRARAGFPHGWMRADWQCQQSFKPFADALARSGIEVAEPAPGDTFALVLVLPPRQREEARALFARAVRHAGADGIVVAAQANSEGARSSEADLARLAGPLHTLSKHKCRVFRTAPRARVDQDLLREWALLDTPRPIGDGRFVSRPGLFAWNRIDAASALLVAQLPSTLAGDVADLGAGYGYLASEIATRCAQVSALDLYEAEARALEPARINLARALADCGRGIPTDFLWHDVTSGLPHRYDVIVSNPPFHQGRADQPDLGRAFISAAAGALRPEGCLYLVANRHLPYEATLDAHFARWSTLVTQQGFKVFHASGVRP